MALLNIVLPLVSLAVGSVVTYWINVRARRQSYQEDLINDAIARLAVAAASVDYVAVAGKPQHQTDEDFQELQRWMVMESMKNWANKLAEANEAVAKVVPYKPELAGLLPVTIDASNRGSHLPIVKILKSG